MALSNIPFGLVQPPQKVQFLFNQFFIFFLLLLPNAMSISFNFPTFNTDNRNLILQGHAYTNPDGLQLTKDTLKGSIGGSVGRALYHERVHLWDNGTGKLNVTDFTTNFSFIINAVDMPTGDGLAFFISPFNSSIPNNSAGGYLGLFSHETAIHGTQNQIVAVEIDTFNNPSWDPSDSSPYAHVGIDINSIVSNKSETLPPSMNITNGSTTNVRVSYDSTSQILSVFLTYATEPPISLSSIVDLTILPEWVSVGFSATTGMSTELHTILSWSFNSTLEAGNVSTQPTNTGGGFNQTEETGDQTNNTGNGSTKKKLALIICLAVSSGVVSCGIGLLWFICWRKRAGGNTEDSGDDGNMDDEFEIGTGPRRFTYRELLNATNNFAERGKLGEGGFGGVYKGLLSESNVEVAVKRVSKGSKQGKKEYKSEVKIIGPVDKRLGMEFDEGQIKSLMVVGLWCCHPDPTSRPSIRQVMHVLNFEASLPNLPSKLPVPMYVGPPMDLCKLSNTSSGFTRSKDQTQCSCSSCSTNSSMSTGPSKPLLYSSKAEVELASTMH
ncbi:hypothetical protein CMV_018397 [Castanea mollissima]|uniref:Legume lectin domain-containing protein n=1 Tax=Castanea mollissima TaxID=60419 RepID=A0A8J4R4N0_9ROSI|nr:hypothetical protein CMV_018397 [Castanea mollissima]